VPHLFLATGADKWGDWREHPWTIGYQPSYRVEAQVYGRAMQAQAPDARYGLLYQNDDFGQDYLLGLRDALGSRFDAQVTLQSYEVTDPTVDSQVVALQSSGATVLLTAATPKFAAQAIRKVHDIGWRPLHFLSNVSISIGGVIVPAGPEKAVGIVSSGYVKVARDPAWAEDPGMVAWRDFMQRYIPDGDLDDSGYVTAYGVSLTMLQVLRQCDGDFSRENIMRQATNLHDHVNPMLLPGIVVNTSPTNYRPIRQMQLHRWTGVSWERFGGIIEGAV
jgi:branched-chain amino acid transport system substrate-binding protein